jgi:hypothetical protein
MMPTAATHGLDPNGQYTKGEGPRPIARKPASRRAGELANRPAGLTCV